MENLIQITFSIPLLIILVFAIYMIKSKKESLLIIPQNKEGIFPFSSIKNKIKIRIILGYIILLTCIVGIIFTYYFSLRFKN